MLLFTLVTVTLKGLLIKQAFLGAPRTHALAVHLSALRVPSWLASRRANHTSAALPTEKMSSNQKRLQLAGWSNCGAYKGAKSALSGLQTIFPKDFVVDINECKNLCRCCFAWNELFSRI